MGIANLFGGRQHDLTELFEFVTIELSNILGTSTGIQSAPLAEIGNHCPVGAVELLGSFGHSYPSPRTNLVFNFHIEHRRECPGSPSITRRCWCGWP